MPPREIKKTVIKYETSVLQSATPSIQLAEQNKNSLHEERQRSRQKDLTEQKINNNHKQVTVDVNSRKARLQAMKKARQQKEKEQTTKMEMNQQRNDDERAGNSQDLNIVVVNNDAQGRVKDESSNIEQKVKHQEVQKQNNGQNPNTLNLKGSNSFPNPHTKTAQQDSSSQQQQGQQLRVLHKPVFLSKEDRSQYHQDQQQVKKRQQQRKKKTLRYTTKLLLQENIRKQQQQNSEQQIDNTNDDQDETNLPDDSDEKNEELEYEMWKIRELKRIRRDREVRQRRMIEKAETDRRRQMNNEQILLENRLLGSDSTEQETQTKYAFMQKYYHKGAFYGDSSDPIFQRDYNMPTPLQMQDKSALPAILQKRKGNFGKKGQSKYTHLTKEDTTDTNPLTRADESLLNGWKKKTAGYKN